MSAAESVEVDASHHHTPEPRIVEYAAEWRQRYLGRMKTNTARSWSAILEQWILPEFGMLKVSQLRRREVADWHTRLVYVHGLAPGTARLYLGKLHAFLDDALVDLEEHLHGRANPARIPRRMKVKAEALFDRNSKVYTPAECRDLTTDRRIPAVRRAFYAAAWRTGLRQSELLGLQWGDIEEREPLRALTVRRHIVRGRVEGGTKTVAEKVVPIGPWLETALRGWRILYERELGIAPEGEAFVFAIRLACGPDQGEVRHMTCDQARYYFRKDTEQVGLRTGLTLHDLRACFLTHAVAAGCSESMMKRITHPKPSDVQSLYLRHQYETLCAELLKFPM